jgi:hypothetical protein
MNDATQVPADEIVDADIWCLLPDCPMKDRHLWGAAGCIDSTPAAADRIGQAVREAWVSWAANLAPEPKPTWLLAWDQLDEQSKQADRAIGLALLTPVYDWLASEFPDRVYQDKPAWLDVDLLAAALARSEPQSGESLDDRRQCIADEMGWEL